MPQRRSLPSVTGAVAESRPPLDRSSAVAYAEPVDYLDRITIEPGKRNGRPCIRGSRMTVSDVLDYLASGMSEDEILRDFPDLEREDIHACLAFAAAGALAGVPTVSQSIVHSSPEISGGTPVFRGTRVPARTLFDYLEGGESLEEFLDQFPSVTRAQALAILASARDSVLTCARSA